MSTFRKVVVLLLLVSFLATSWAPASPWLTRLEPAQAESQALFGRAWAFLRSLWNKTGCNIDPSGRCALEPAWAVPGDTGCNIDPDGLCAPTTDPALPTSGKTGCHIDPDGLCHS